MAAQRRVDQLLRRSKRCQFGRAVKRELMWPVRWLPEAEARHGGSEAVQQGERDGSDLGPGMVHVTAQALGDNGRVLATGAPPG